MIPVLVKSKKDVLHHDEQQGIFKLDIIKCEGVESNRGVANGDFFIYRDVFTCCGSSCGNRMWVTFHLGINNRVWETFHCSWKN